MKFLQSCIIPVPSCSRGRTRILDQLEQKSKKRRVSKQFWQKRANKIRRERIWRSHQRDISNSPTLSPHQPNQQTAGSNSSLKSSQSYPVSAVGLKSPHQRLQVLLYTDEGFGFGFSSILSLWYWVRNHSSLGFYLDERKRKRKSKMVRSSQGLFW